MLIQSAPNDNHETTPEFFIKTNGAGADQHRPVYGFSLPVIPAGETITAVSLRLWVTQRDTDVARVHRITDAWVERTVT